MYWLKKIGRAWIFFADAFGMAVAIVLTQTIAPHSDLLPKLCDRLKVMEDQVTEELGELKEMEDHIRKESDDE